MAQRAMSDGTALHRRAMALCDEGDLMRMLRQREKARLAFRRACALEARAARLQESAYSAALLWCSAGWCAHAGGYMGAALKCAKRGLAVLVGLEYGWTRGRLEAGMHELRAAALKGQG